MAKQEISLLGVAIAAIAGSLSLPVMSVAQAQQGATVIPVTKHQSRSVQDEPHDSTDAPYAMQPEVYDYTPNPDYAPNPHVMPAEMDPWTPRLERPFPDYPFHGYNGG